MAVARTMTDHQSDGSMTADTNMRSESRTNAPTVTLGDVTFDPVATSDFRLSVRLIELDS